MSQQLPLPSLLAELAAALAVARQPRHEAAPVCRRIDAAATNHDLAGLPRQQLIAGRRKRAPKLARVAHLIGPRMSRAPAM